jgi:hypothetical protein
MSANLARMSIGLAVLLLAGCAASTVTTRWRDPTVKTLQFDRIAAVAISTDGPQRRLAEGEMARQMGPKAVAATQIVGDTERGDPERVREALARAGVDGAVTMRLLNFDTDLTMNRDPVPTQYMQLWDYYGFGWAAVTEPAYLGANTFVQVEINIYSVKDGKLLWSGVSRSERPQLVETLVKDVAPSVASTLRREGLLPRT